MLIHNADITGSLTINGVPYSTGSFTGSFYGDGSQLSGVTSYTDADTLAFINSLDVVSGSIQTVSTVSDTFTSVTSYTVTHNFGTKEVIVSVYENDTLIFPSSITTPTINTVTITFPEPVTGRIVVVKAGHIVSGSINYNSVLNKPTLVSGSSQISFTGITNKPTLVSGSSQITYSGITGKPNGIVSGSSQITYSGLTGIPSGIVSGSTQVAQFGYATTGSNQFKASQTITGSLTVTGVIVAQTLNVQQVTSSIVYSSGSNVFGNNSGNTHQFTGSLQVSGSSHYLFGNLGVGTTNPAARLQIIRDGVGSSNTSLDGSQLVLSRTVGNAENIAFRNTGASNGISGTNYAGQIVSYGNNILEIYTNVSNPIIFGTEATERMRITPSGSIEIGTTGISSPSGADRFIGVYGAQDSSLILQDNVQTWELYVNDDFYINRGSTNVLTLNRTTGAATFSSSVTADSLIIANNDARIRNNDATGRIILGNSSTNTFAIFYGTSHPTNANQTVFANGGVTTCTFSSTGTATFSSTVQSVGALLAGNAGATTGQIIIESGANAASRRWKLLTSQNVNGDFVIQQSTTQTGSTFADILGFNATGAATFSSGVTINGTGNPALDVQGTAIIRGNGSAHPTHYLTTAAANVAQYNQYDASGNIKNRFSAGGDNYITGGNVGIGTTTPTTYSLNGRHLEVNDAGGGYSFIHSNTTTVKSFFASNESALLTALFTFSNHPLTFGTNNTERVRITSGGSMFNRASTAGHTAFIGAIGPGNVGNRYLHVRINTIVNMMVWIKVFGYAYTVGNIEGLSGCYIDGGTGAVAQSYQNGSIVAQHQNSNYLEIVVDTVSTATTNRWGSISFMGGTDNLTTIQPLEIIAYSWTSTTTRVY